MFNIPPSSLFKEKKSAHGRLSVAPVMVFQSVRAVLEYVCEWIQPAMLPHLLSLYQAATLTGMPLRINKNLWGFMGIFLIFIWLTYLG